MHNASVGLPVIPIPDNRLSVVMPMTTMQRFLGLGTLVTASILIMAGPWITRISKIIPALFHDDDERDPDIRTLIAPDNYACSEELHHDNNHNDEGNYWMIACWDVYHYMDELSHLVASYQRRRWQIPEIIDTDKEWGTIVILIIQVYHISNVMMMMMIGVVLRPLLCTW